MEINAQQYESWNKFTKGHIVNPDKKLSSIVLFRQTEIRGKAINVYIDGEYQASLLPGAYTQAMIDPGIHHVTLAYTNPLSHYQEKKERGESVKLKSGKIFYCQILDNGETGLKISDLSQKEVIAFSHKRHLKQSHTISRLTKKNK